MRILVTNDDGIHSDGLWRLAEALSMRWEYHIDNIYGMVRLGGMIIMLRYF